MRLWSRGTVSVAAVMLALAAPSALAATRQHSAGTAASAAPLKAMWGPATHKGVSLFPTFRDLGVNVYEDSLHWNVIAPRRPRHPRNPNDPAYVWPAEVTSSVTEAKRNGMRVALEIIGAPGWTNGHQSQRWAPHRVGDYADFAIAASRRYPSVRLWMIWGEPSRSKNFRPLTPARPYTKLNASQWFAPHLYSRMLDAAYGALKRVRRSNIVIGGMTDAAASISTPQWIENMRLPDGRPPRLDLYGHNPFSIRAPNLANPPSPGQQIDFSDLGRLTSLVDSNLGTPANPHPGLFLSEWTIPTAPDTEFNFFVESRLQALWISDAFSVAKQLGNVYALGWIHLYDEPPKSAGGLITASGVKKPGYFAWRKG